jgi:hypothetical protein
VSPPPPYPLMPLLPRGFSHCVFFFSLHKGGYIRWLSTLRKRVAFFLERREFPWTRDAAGGVPVHCIRHHFLFFCASFPFASRFLFVQEAERSRDHR